jgi:dCMP deaminase
MKQKFISAYIDIAKRFSKLSTARRLQVGAIIVKDNRIISIGYNGTPSGWDNECEDVVIDENGVETLITKPETIHAEANAIAKLARSSDSGEGSVMFLTHSPCQECAKQIFAAGIKKVFYSENYRDESGINFLKRAHVEVQHVVNDQNNL